MSQFKNLCETQDRYETFYWRAITLIINKNKHLSSRCKLVYILYGKNSFTPNVKASLIYKYSRAQLYSWRILKSPTFFKFKSSRHGRRHCISPSPPLPTTQFPNGVTNPASCAPNAIKKSATEGEQASDSRLLYIPWSSQPGHLQELSAMKCHALLNWKFIQKLTSVSSRLVPVIPIRLTLCHSPCAGYLILELHQIYSPVNISTSACTVAVCRPTVSKTD